MSNSVSFNIKVTVEVEPAIQKQENNEEDVTPIDEVFTKNKPLKDYKKYYCDACDCIVALSSAYHHVCSDKHIKNVKKMIAEFAP